MALVKPGERNNRCIGASRNCLPFITIPVDDQVVILGLVARNVELGIDIVFPIFVIVEVIGKNIGNNGNMGMNRWRAQQLKTGQLRDDRIIGSHLFSSLAE